MRQQGFTLVEIMIAMVVIAILGAIAMPSYTSYMKKSARQEARQLLLQAAVRQETRLVRTGSYAASMSALGYAADSVPAGSGRYTVTVSAATANSYTLAATPTTKGGQNNDPCGTFTVNHLGERGITTAANPAPSAQTCWH